MENNVPGKISHAPALQTSSVVHVTQESRRYATKVLQWRPPGLTHSYAQGAFEHYRHHTLTGCGGPRPRDCQGSWPEGSRALEGRGWCPVGKGCLARFRLRLPDQTKQCNATSGGPPPCPARGVPSSWFCDRCGSPRLQLLQLWSAGGRGAATPSSASAACGMPPCQRISKPIVARCPSYFALLALRCLRASPETGRSGGACAFRLKRMVSPTGPQGCGAASGTAVVVERKREWLTL